MIDFWRLPCAKVCLVVILLIVGIDALCVVISPFGIRLSNFEDTAIVVPGLVLMMGLMALVVRRLQGDEAKPAQVIRSVCGRVFDFCAASAVTALFIDSAALSSAYAASVSFPMQDAFFSGVDRALGFDWEAVVAWINGSPALVWLLIQSYKSFAYTLPLCVAFFIVMGRSKELWEFQALMAVTCAIAIVISCFAPAIGGYTYYGPGPHSTSEILRQMPDAGTYYVAGLLKAHSGLVNVLDITEIKGIIQFPSFHGIMALILIYMTRKDRWLFWPSLAINTVMLVSTVPVGGHHAVDLLGSFVVFLASVALLGALDGKPSLGARFQAWIARVQAGWPGRLARPVAAYARRALNSSGTRRPAGAVRRV